jgi:imidazole glycerol phosphate synthase glutamine amidotransferase subunit
MNNLPVQVVPTGTANMASVLAGLERAGACAQITADPDRIRSAERLVLPGVGALGAAMSRLQENGLVEALRERLQEGQPTLAVCVGLQILCESSAESPGVRGLGVLGGRVERFDRSVRVPQMGWNRVEADDGCRLIESGFAYFANSYRLVDPPDGFCAAFSDHGGRFVAALERGGVLACQFHPELSGQWGLALIKRWLDQNRGGTC